MQKYLYIKILKIKMHCFMNKLLFNMFTLFMFSFTNLIL